MVSVDDPPECFRPSIFQVTSDTRSRASLDSPLQKPGRWFGWKCSVQLIIGFLRGGGDSPSLP